MAATYAKISALPAATTLADTDLLAVYILSGSTFAANKMTVANAKLVFGVPADTGWVANQSAGDKTVIVGDFDPAVSFVGSDTVSIMALAFFWSYFGLVVQKVQAIESALANNVRPNA